MNGHIVTVNGKRYLLSNETQYSFNGVTLEPDYVLHPHTKDWYSMDTPAANAILNYYREQKELFQRQQEVTEEKTLFQGQQEGTEERKFVRPLVKPQKFPQVAKRKAPRSNSTQKVAKKMKPVKALPVKQQPCFEARVLRTKDLIKSDMTNMWANKIAQKGLLKM